MFCYSKFFQQIQRIIYRNRGIVFCFVLLLLTACKVEVYRGLDEMQANAMLAALLKHGISASKQDTGKTGYTIFVDKSKLAESLELLRERGFPKEQYKSIGTIFTGEGMVASASEEQARLSYALSQELSDTISRVNGVLSSRVHIALASLDQDMEEKRTPASAAVFLLHRPGSLVINLESKVRELVAMSVPELTPEQVSVVFVPVRESLTIPTTGSSNISGGIFFSEGHVSVIFIFMACISIVIVGTLVVINFYFWREVLFTYLKPGKTKENVIKEDE